MPHIRIKSLSEEHIKILSQTLPKDLASIMETEEDNFSFELISNQYFLNGTAIQSYPYIEIHWFERSQDCKEKSAKFITNQVQNLTKADDVAVVFIPIKKSDYFENGKSF